MLFQRDSKIEPEESSNSFYQQIDEEKYEIPYPYPEQKEIISEY